MKHAEVESVLENVCLHLCAWCIYILTAGLGQCATHCAALYSVGNSVCNPRILNPEIPSISANLESQDWQHPNPGILGLQNIVKIALFGVLNDKITIVAI